MLVFTYKLIYIGAEMVMGDGFGGSDVPFVAAGGSGSGSGSRRGSVLIVGGEPGSCFGIWAKLDYVKFRRGQKIEKYKEESRILLHGALKSYKRNRNL